MKIPQEITDLAKRKIKQWRNIINGLEVKSVLRKVEKEDMLNKENQSLSAYIEKQDELSKGEEKTCYPKTEFYQGI